MTDTLKPATPRQEAARRRRHGVLALWEAGSSYRDIGKLLNVSNTRVQQLVWRAKHEREIERRRALR
jgi:hypothetical protein